MSNSSHSVHKKVRAIFAEFLGDQALRLNRSDIAETRQIFASALSSSYSSQATRDIAFHLSDWHMDAAFTMAAHLFPERFTTEEIQAGAEMLLLHVPNHLAAAAKLAGHPIEDVFDVGLFDDAES